MLSPTVIIKSIPVTHKETDEENWGGILIIELLNMQLQIREMPLICFSFQFNFVGALDYVGQAHNFKLHLLHESPRHLIY